MNQPFMPVLESFTRNWPDFEAAHGRAAAAACALLQHGDALLSVLTRVATHRSARDELLRAVATLAGAPRELARHEPPQHTRISAFLPPHNLLYAYVVHGLVPALYADEVVLRPTERTQHTANALHKALTRHLDPALTEHVQLTDATPQQFAPVCAESDAVVFWGVPEDAHAAMAAIGERPLFLALGPAPDPLVVGPRTEPAAACRAVLRARLHNSGQDRLCPDVIFVHRLRLDALVERLRAELSVLTVGVRTWPDTVLTSMIYSDAVERTARFLEEHRDHVVTGGTADPDRMLVEPTLLVLPESPGFHPPELLTPVFCLVPYDDPALIREWARDPLELERGRYASVLGEPRLTGETLGTAALLRNTTAHDVEDGNRPFGGFGAHAGGVRHGGRLIGRPLLLSQEASLRRPVITGPLR
ncbi:aldehyde dehydrogenase family protein [Streptomyces sp. NPDC048172]|uniref:aldehyde dehydrogenase family protein n=1 Tax=Streptomyces sp. NPDC048172 TaxID=3365505 RepID=UPI003724A1DC